MPALVVNGLAVPARTDALDVSEEEVGARKRTASGRLAVARLALARVIEGGTSWLRTSEARAWAGLLSGRGDVWHFDLTSSLADTASVRSRAATTATVATRLAETVAHSTSSEFTHPKFGTGCIAIEDASTNLWAANVATGTDTSSNTTGFTLIAGATLSSSTDAAWQGSRSLKCIAAGAADGFYTDDFVAAAATDHAASVYLKASAALNVTVKLRNETDGVDGTAKTVTLSTSWKRVEVVGPAGIGIGESLRLVVTAAAAGTLYADGLQLEARAWPTTWAATTRSAGALAYTLGELRDTDDLTVLCWTRGMCAGIGGVVATPAAYLFSIGDASNRIEFANIASAAGNGEQELRVVASGVSALASSSTNFGTGLAPDEWALVAVTVRRAPQAGEYSATLYVNSVVQGQQPSVALPRFGGSPVLRVGADYAGNNRWNGLIDDLVVLPYALTATQIADIYAAARAFSDLPELDVWGDAIGVDDATPVRCIGTPARMVTTSARPSAATAQETVHQVAFRLEESDPLASS